MFLLLALACAPEIPSKPRVEDTGTCARTWYRDTDGDGVGDGSRGTASGCAPPAGYVEADGDCDDLDATSFPDAAESCDGADDDCDGEADEDAVDVPRWHADTDGDGFGDPLAAVSACTAPAGHVADASDCDDADPLTSPAGTETCDGADQDCDGAVDDDPIDFPTWYADTDGDGFGDPTNITLACDLPPAHVADATDCDDADPRAHPGGVEVCGGGDEDCDGRVDIDAIDPATWHADTDGDGFGDPGVTTLACDAPPAHVADGTDCDDTDPAVSPGAGEVCGGGDEDCDGVVDEDDAIDVPTWHRDADIDGRGSPTDTVTTCARPYGYVGDGTDCDDTDPAVHPGMGELCATPYDDNCDGDLVSAGAVDCVDWYADADLDGFGDPDAARCQCAAGDGFDADNADDCDDTDPAAFPGAPEVWGDAVDQSCDGDGDAAHLSDEAVLLSGVTPGDTAGFAVGGGDFDGDGLPDLVIGAPAVDTTVENAGAVYVWFGAPTQSASLSAADLLFTGTDAGHRAGSSVSGGDLDGDGLYDLAIGAPEAGYGGAAYVLLAPGPTSAVGTADVQITSSSFSQALGAYVGLVGDLDGDGGDELVVGPDHNSLTASIHVFAAPAGALSDLDATAVLGPATTTGATAGDLGATVAGGGDIDGNGTFDLAFGEPFDLFPDARGAVQLVLDIPTGTVTLDDTDATLQGSYGSNAGTAVHLLGDADGDGLADLLVGAWHDDTAGSDAGGAWFVWGR